MEEARKEVRKTILCNVALFLCFTVRASRSNLETEDVISICNLIGSMCRNYCDKPSGKCRDAVEALQKGDEKQYLTLCAEALKQCHYSNGGSTREKTAPYLA